MTMINDDDNNEKPQLSNSSISKSSVMIMISYSSEVVVATKL